MLLDDSQDFEQAYLTYAEKIYRFLYWQTRDQALAEDLTGEAFSRAWRRRDSFSDGSVQAWLFQIARNLLIDYRRKRKELPLDESGEIMGSLQQDGVAAQAVRADQIWQMHQAIDTLPDNLRGVTVLRFIEELSVREVAEILDLSEGNVRVLQFRALQRLRGILDHG
jgi:RNA polymerase sigma-70 factor (ECF subfamily)